MTDARLKPDSPAAAKVFPSPNHGERVGVDAPDILLLHYTGMQDAGSALQWLCNPVSQVSCHYFVFEDGRVLQLVPEGRRAWHAGRSAWEGGGDVNSRSIGVEIVNPGFEWGYRDFPDEQIAAVTLLCRDVAERWRIRPSHVLAHSDVAPTRKRDPGERFPWGRLHAAGIGHWTVPAPLGGGRALTRGEEGRPIAALQAMLALYGYVLDPSGVFDEETEAVVRAFQRHFRPALVDGVADASTITTLRDLIASRPPPEAAI